MFGNSWKLIFAHLFLTNICSRYGWGWIYSLYLQWLRGLVVINKTFVPTIVRFKYFFIWRIFFILISTSLRSVGCLSLIKIGGFHIYRSAIFFSKTSLWYFHKICKIHFRSWTVINRARLIAYFKQPKLFILLVLILRCLIFLAHLVYVEVKITSLDMLLAICSSFLGLNGILADIFSLLLQRLLCFHDPLS